MWHEAVPSLPSTRRYAMIARDIMTRKVYTIFPEASVQEIAQLLSRKSISGVPVLDNDGKMIGIVTEADIIGKVNREDLRVADIMSPEIIVVSNSCQICGQTRTTAVPTALRQSSQSVFLSHPDRLSSQVMPVARDASRNITSRGPVAAPPPCVRAHLPAGLACQSLSGCPSGKLLPRHL